MNVMLKSDSSLTQGKALTQFCCFAMKEDRFAEFHTGEACDPAIDYHFRYSAEVTETSFCRRLFRRTMATRLVSLARSLPGREVTVITSESDTVSFSGFRSLAYHLQRWLAIDLHAPQDGDYRFQVATCGGVRLWLAEEQQLCFTPFTRNTLQRCEVSLPLRAGKNSLRIHLEELFERDTIFTLQMIYLDTPTLGMTLPDTGFTHVGTPVAPTVTGDPVAGECASRLLAQLHQHEYSPICDTLLQSTLKCISAREEGSIYSLLPLLWIWRDHQGTCFPATMWRRVKSSLLGYRYWQDEPGCDVMRFNGESQALCFHIAQYLAGQFFPDEQFIASGRRGREQQALAETRLALWFVAKDARQETIRPAFNDETGLFALAQMAEATWLRERARNMLDRLKKSYSPEYDLLERRLFRR